jgi:hypothetical protein
MNEALWREQTCRFLKPISQRKGIYSENGMLMSSFPFLNQIV